MGHPGRTPRFHRPPPRRARVGALVLRRQGPGQARHPADLLQRRLRRARRDRRRGRGHAVRRVPARGRLRAAGHDAPRASTAHPPPRPCPASTTSPASPPSCGPRRSPPPSTTPPASRSPAWTASCPATAGRSPTTGGWASRSATASPRTGRARSSSPRTFGHFGQSGTFLWVDPDAGAAAVVLTDRDFGPWAIEAWPVWTDGCWPRSTEPHCSAVSAEPECSVRPLRLARSRRSADRREWTGGAPCCTGCPRQVIRVPGSQPSPPTGVPRAERRPAPGADAILLPQPTASRRFPRPERRGRDGRRRTPTAPPPTHRRERGTDMRGDRVEIVIDAGSGTTRTYDVIATRAGRKVTDHARARGRRGRRGHPRRHRRAHRAVPRQPRARAGRAPGGRRSGGRRDHPHPPPGLTPGTLEHDGAPRRTRGPGAPAARRSRVRAQAARAADPARQPRRRRRTQRRGPATRPRGRPAAGRRRAGPSADADSPRRPPTAARRRPRVDGPATADGPANGSRPAPRRGPRPPPRPRSPTATTTGPPRRSPTPPARSPRSPSASPRSPCADEHRLARRLATAARTRDGAGAREGPGRRRRRGSTPPSSASPPAAPPSRRSPTRPSCRSAPAATTSPPPSATTRS